MRSATRSSLQAGVQTLRNRGIFFSEQRVMRECLRIALKFWRGGKGIARRNKKYNPCSGPYEIVPFYTTEALRSVAWARCHHSGISLSRMMDFAVANYLQRVLEYWLRFEYTEQDKLDASLWQMKYAQRRNCSDFVISYEGITVENNGIILAYHEKSTILPWPPPQNASF
jgi:hypothetical protein